MFAGVYERAVGNSLLLVKAGFNCSLLKIPECHIKKKALQQNMSFRAELKMNVEPRNKVAWTGLQNHDFCHAACLTVLLFRILAWQRKLDSKPWLHAIP